MAFLYVRGAIEPIHNKTFALPKLIEGFLFCTRVIVGKASKHMRYLAVCDFVASRDKTHRLVRKHIISAQLGSYQAFTAP